MTDEQTGERSIGKRANEINAAIRYTMWSVFRLARPLADDARSAIADEVQALIDELAGKDVVVRGTYDVSGLRADADLLVWWHATTPEALARLSTITCCLSASESFAPKIRASRSVVPPGAAGVSSRIGRLG